MNPKPSGKPQLLKLSFATVLVGIGSGILGMLLAMLLHAIQHLAYGYSLNQVISDESFLQGVRASSPLRRVSMLMLCGVIAGTGWWVLYRFGKPLVSITQAIKTRKTMPRLTTTFHILLQIVTIALGSPLGREVAPREASAVFADWLSRKLHLSAQDRRLMLACGAGAGLAAVYNVPLGGALFTLEVLLVTFRFSVVLPALTTSIIAVLVSWIGLGNHPLYHIPLLTIDSGLVIWSLLMGPMFGIAAFGFISLINKARANPLRRWPMPLVSLINFTLIGVLAIAFPSLLGNGKSPAQLEFAQGLSIELSLMLLFLRTLICWSSIKSGAQGGLLTPSLANGALLAVALGGLWQFAFPNTSLSACALVGAVAFLASAQKMPFTALILIIELTRVDLSFIVPMGLAITGAVSMSRLCQQAFE